MRLGGYVIHGNAAETLPRCLDSLLAVCDEVVAVDSASTDGSADLDRARGVRVVSHPWEGYGAARAVGARALAGCDYQLFLDSDEWFGPEAIEALRAWKRSGPTAPRYVLLRNDWAELPTGRFVFRTEHHVRIARRDAATWDRARSNCWRGWASMTAACPRPGRPPSRPQRHPPALRPSPQPFRNPRFSRSRTAASARW